MDRLRLHFSGVQKKLILAKQAGIKKDINVDCIFLLLVLLWRTNIQYVMLSSLTVFKRTVSHLICVDAVLSRLESDVPLQSSS